MQVLSLSLSFSLSPSLHPPLSLSLSCCIRLLEWKQSEVKDFFVYRNNRVACCCYLIFKNGIIVSHYFGHVIYTPQNNTYKNIAKLLTHPCICKRLLYIYIQEHTRSFQSFFVWPLLLIVNTWNSSPLRINLLRLQCTCCTVPTTSGRTHGSPLVSACQWPSSQPL